MSKINWTLRSFRLDELTDYYKNPRSLSEKEFKQLKTSLDKFGMIDKPIVNADSANTIIGGHQRKHVLEATGVKEIDCWIPDRELSDKEVEELNIRLNKNTGSWDFDTLANEFELDDLLDWGFDKGELDLDLWASDAPEDVEPQIDKAEELRVKWGVETGQLWQLGEHRLICGDCTDKAVVERVMGGEKADMVFTDPPYGMDFQGSVNGDGTPSANRKLNQIVNETGTDLSKREFIDSWLPVVTSLTDYGWYICYSRHNLRNMLNAIEDFKIPLRNIIIWNKNRQNIANTDYKSKYELILYGWNKRQFYGALGDNDVWEIDKLNKAELHPTMKPVELVEKAINNSSLGDGIVADLFLGSGTTLIACERLGRKCRAVEISPAYVAVAIQRWVDVTGGEPVLIEEI